MKFRELIVMALLFGLIAWNVRGCLVKPQKTEQMIRDEVELEHLQKDLPGIIKQRDSIQAKYDSTIAVSNQRFNELENRKQPIRNAINKIHTTVDNFDREQLRREFANGK